MSKPIGASPYVNETSKTDGGYIMQLLNAVCFLCFGVVFFVRKKCAKIIQTYHPRRVRNLKGNETCF